MKAEDFKALLGAGWTVVTEPHRQMCTVSHDDGTLARFSDSTLDDMTDTVATGVVGALHRAAEAGASTVAIEVTRCDDGGYTYKWIDAGAPISRR